MLNLGGPVDRYDRKELSVDQSFDDNQARFTMTIRSSDFPPQFENSQNRKVSLSIVEGIDWKGDDSINAILIPLVVTGMSHINGKTKTYYRQKYDSDNMQLSSMIQLDGFTIKDNDSSEKISDPHLLVVLEVEVQEQSNQSLQGSHQELSGSDNGTGNSYDSRPHVERNENANGGLDLPRGEVKSDLAERERESESRGTLANTL